MGALLVARSWVASMVARLSRRGQPRTSPVDSFDAILAASVETGGVITVLGVARWLGYTTSDPDDSIESYEAYLERLSEQVA